MAVKIAVVGQGVYGNKVSTVLFAEQKRGNCELVAVSDVNVARLKEAQEKYNCHGYVDYKEMLDKEKPDCVAIVTPDFLHAEVCREAAIRGIHVLCEKPLATNKEEALAMVKVCKENNVMLYVDFHKRFDPCHKQLKQAIKSGKLGKVLYGYACMEDKLLVPADWFTNWAKNSSPAWFLGAHFYDLIYWLMEEKPCKVFATGQKEKLVSMGIDTYDAIQADLMFPSGANIHVDSSWIIPNNFTSIVNQQIRIVGSEGMQEVDTQDRGTVAAYKDESYSQVLNISAAFTDEDPIYGETLSGYTIDSITYFITLANAMANGKYSLEGLNGKYPSGEEGAVSVIFGEAVHRSIISKEIETVEY